MKKGMRKIKFVELLKFPKLTEVMYLVNRILKNRGKYTKWLDKWSKTGISKELFHYSASEHEYKYNWLGVTRADMELWLYRFIHPHTPALKKLKVTEFPKDYIYLQCGNDFVSYQGLKELEGFNGKRTKKWEETAYIENLNLFTVGERYHLSYDVEIPSKIGDYSGDEIKQNKDELLKDFLYRCKRFLENKIKDKEKI